MFKRCGALVLGLMVLSSSGAMAQGSCRRGGPLVNGVPGQVAFPVNNGAGYYDARTGGRYVAPGYGVYNAAGAYSNPNVQVYQNQLNQAYQVQAYQAYNNGYGYNNGGYNNGGYANGYNNGYGQVTVSPYGGYNQPGYVAVTPVGVNPWNGYAGNTYNGYTYPTTIQNGYGYQNGGRRGNNCRAHVGGGVNNPYGRFWVSR